MEHIKLRLTAIYHQLIAHEVVITHLKHYTVQSPTYSSCPQPSSGSSRKGFLTPLDSYFAETSQHQLCIVDTEDNKRVKC